ncbi:MAG: CRISPR-associated endonuclease Cas2 [Clostridiales bacterium]|nr:CRISPR-associated endonuclease Cas2 [Clostridiales bacterium]
MRLLVFFDLPTGTKQERKNYAIFRKFLIKHGFSMLQFSVYERITRNHDDCEKYISMIELNKPPQGDIRCLRVTEKQYESIRLIIGSNEGKNDYSDDDFIEI